MGLIVAARTQGFVQSMRPTESRQARKAKRRDEVNSIGSHVSIREVSCLRRIIASSARTPSVDRSTPGAKSAVGQPRRASQSIKPNLHRPTVSSPITRVRSRTDQLAVVWLLAHHVLYYELCLRIQCSFPKVNGILG